MDGKGLISQMADASPFEVLADLLQSGRAQPALSSDRLAPSAFYDLHYRVMVIASTVEIHAQADVAGNRQIQTGRLKLLQFVACRPWLMPTLREWSGTRRARQLSVLSTQRFRRGFLGDTTHDRVVDFLVAHSVFVRLGVHLVTDLNVHILSTLYSSAVDQQLFSAERQALHDLLGVKITNRMLEGQ